MLSAVYGWLDGFRTTWSRSIWLLSLANKYGVVFLFLGTPRLALQQD